jgi:hypothetical protein
MKHLSLDAENEFVKQFVRGLSSAADATILELEGRPVIYVMPMPRSNVATGPSDDWTEEKNSRRCALIDKKIDGSLAATEVAELDQLQKEMLQHRRRVAPLPLEEARALHQQLLNMPPPAQNIP